jgi:hypothetical protein
MYLKGLKRFRNDWRQTARRKATLTDHSDWARQMRSNCHLVRTRTAKQSNLQASTGEDTL